MTLSPFPAEYLKREKQMYGDNFGSFQSWMTEMSRAAVTFLRHGFVGGVAAARSRWAVPQGYDFPETASVSYTSMLRLFCVVGEKLEGTPRMAYGGEVSLHHVLRALSASGSNGKPRVEMFLEKTSLGNHLNVTKFRAIQGHSTDVGDAFSNRTRLDAKKVVAQSLIHGTQSSCCQSIIDAGLIPGGRGQRQRRA